MSFTNETLIPCDKKRKILTLVFIVEDKKILLGMKKRGFGVGKWNGFGGKVDVGKETIEEAAQRELQEECGLTALDLQQRGIIFFEFEKEIDELFEVHLFMATKYSGTAAETEEMLPEWYDLDDIPYRFMWVDDKHWLPIAIAGKNLKAHFVFSDMKTIKNFELQLLA
ncbi:oxidized purine nucleoside triphosphate hydrolase [Acrasis kona]|uniref:Oxidized purine nucleoside triphosphate hydrolase n=1 Tax=Acrasis kona TaxID=1008807 RepID=A0AAW2ZC14_9EUKA